MSEQYRSRIERKKAQRSKPKKRQKSLVKRILTAIAIIFLLAFIGGTITVFAMLSGTPELDPEKLKDPVASTLLDKNDEEFAKMSGAENREVVSIQEIPQIVKDATLAIEDVRFYDHFGLDIRRIFGAVLANVKEGYGSEGASTITQQVIKRSFLTPEKTMKRKVQEAYLAIQLERKYSKDQILEMYLNKIYYGKGAYGIKTAAETYFQKELDELTISEAALLAGLPQRPHYLDPTKNPEAAQKRRDTVINAMLKYGFINESQAEEAKAINVEDMLNVKEKEAMKYSAFIDQVFEEVEQIEGLSARDIYESGLTIYTTLDPKAQEHVEGILENDSYFPDSKFQAGIALVDTETGAVRALGGGREKALEEDEKVERGFNYATNAKRQPGSAIKPILAYGPVIEHLKWSTAKLIKDEKLVINGKEIRNWDRKHRGQVSMRQALEWSYNVPAVNAFLEVGADRAKEFAKGLGIPLDEVTPSYAIGGFKHGISPLQLAGAYAAFGNEGVYNKPHLVRKIVFPDGREINTTPEPVAAMSDYTAYMVTDMLKTVVQSGTGTRGRVPSLPMAGKTGTTNLPENIRGSGTSDGWFVGYTTRYTAAVWTGYKKTTQETYIKNRIGSTVAQRIVKDTLAYVSQGIETPDFKKPNSVVEVPIEIGTEKKASPFTPKDKVSYELFVRGTEPTEVSDAYDEIPAPTGLSAEYDESSQSIYLSWNHPNAEDVIFHVNMSIDGGSMQSLSPTGDLSMTISNAIPGATYYFEVVAVYEETGERSEPASTRIDIPSSFEEEEPEEPVEDDGEQEEDVQDGEDTGNQNNEQPTDRNNPSQPNTQQPSGTQQVVPQQGRFNHINWIRFILKSIGF